MTSRAIFGMLSGVLAIGALSVPLRAGIVAGGPGDPGIGDCIPFGCSDAAVFQQLFDSSLFPGPVTIAGLSFSLNNFDNVNPVTGGPIVPNEILPANYTIQFSVVPINVNELDPTLENNLNPLLTQTFFIGFLNGAVNGQFTIQTTPENYFLYDPASGSNLLMQISTDSTDLSLTLYLDINTSSAGLFSSAFDSNPHPFGCPDGSPGQTTGCTNANSGLVVEFLSPTDLVTIPEPAAAWTGLAGLLLITLRRKLRRP